MLWTFYPAKNNLRCLSGPTILRFGSVGWRPGVFQQNRPTAVIEARIYQRLFCGETVKVIPSIENPAVIKQILDHSDRRAGEQPLALALLARSPPLCTRPRDPMSGRDHDGPRKPEPNQMAEPTLWATKASKLLHHVDAEMIILTVRGKCFPGFQKSMTIIKTQEVGHHFGGPQR